MDCEILTIGTELVLGYVVNTNAAVMGRTLAAAGIAVRRSTAVSDDVALVQDAVQAALDRTGVVIVSGGLGPTRDDVTRNAVAELLRRPLKRDDAIVEQLRERFRSRGVANMPESNLVQADVPEGATVLPNPLGTAPGLWLEDGERIVVLIPGVPKEMRGLLETEVVPRLKARRGGTGNGERGTVVRSRTLRTTGIGESALADRLGDYEKALGSTVTLAYLPSTAGTELRLTAWNVPESEVDGVLAHAVDAIRPRIEDRVYGEEDQDLAAVVLELLDQRQLKIAVAESCTGGLLGARLAAIPGASRLFKGGVIAYDNEVKLQMLGVSADALAEHGAVSEEVARQMAAGIARALDAGAAIAVTGVAGPDGGSDAKPVGTVWFGVKVGDTVRAFHLVLPGDRTDIQARAAQYALDFLRRMLAGTL